MRSEELKGGTLLVSRHKKLLPHFKKRLEALGFPDVHVTDKDKDGLNMIINEIKPQYLLMSSNFYYAATPYMVGQLVRLFPRLTVAAVTIAPFPDDLAANFIFHGVGYYINLFDGLDEFYHGLHCILKGKKYVSPAVQHIINGLAEWPEVKEKANQRQIEVLLLLCNGYCNIDIADCLHISRKTVDYHIETLKKVFHVHTREQIICMAFYLDMVRKEDMVFFSLYSKKIVKPKWRAE
jgi:DNA-binding NarL/FixJ family response regulator